MSQNQEVGFQGARSYIVEGWAIRKADRIHKFFAVDAHFIPPGIEPKGTIKKCYFG